MVVRYLCEVMEESNMSVVFRPYPNLEQWQPYEELKAVKNLTFDQFEKSGTHTFSEEDLIYKLQMIHAAQAIVHCGTTIGLEASYLDTPILYLNIGDMDFGLKENHHNHIARAWQQDHLQKYFFKPEFENVVETKADLKKVILSLSEGEEQLLGYNDLLRSYTELKSIEQVAEDIKVIFQNNSNSNPV